MQTTTFTGTHQLQLVQAAGPASTTTTAALLYQPSGHKATGSATDLPSRRRQLHTAAPTLNSNTDTELPLSPPKRLRLNHKQAPPDSFPATADKAIRRHKAYYLRNRALRNRCTTRPKKEEKSWTCPYCELQIIQDPEARADQLSRKRLHHIRTAHPDKPQPNVCKRRQAIEASNALPDTLKAWVCPICYAALPELEERLKHDSICKHITDHHPKETLRSLNSKQARAKLPPWHRKDQTLGAKQQKRLHDAAIKTAKQHGHLPAIAPDDTMGSQ